MAALQQSPSQNAGASLLVMQRARQRYFAIFARLEFVDYCSNFWDQVVRCTPKYSRLRIRNSLRSAKPQDFRGATSQQYSWRFSGLQECGAELSDGALGYTCSQGELPCTYSLRYHRIDTACALGLLCACALYPRHDRRVRNHLQRALQPASCNPGLQNVAYQGPPLSLTLNPGTDGAGFVRTGLADKSCKETPLESRTLCKATRQSTVVGWRLVLSWTRYCGGRGRLPRGQPLLQPLLQHLHAGCRQPPS